MNYYYPTSLTELREGIERSMDRGAMDSQSRGVDG